MRHRTNTKLFLLDDNGGSDTEIWFDIEDEQEEADPDTVFEDVDSTDTDIDGEGCDDADLV